MHQRVAKPRQSTEPCPQRQGVPRCAGDPPNRRPSSPARSSRSRSCPQPDSDEGFAEGWSKPHPLGIDGRGQGASGLTPPPWGFMQGPEESVVPDLGRVVVARRTLELLDDGLPESVLSLNSVPFCRLLRSTNVGVVVLCRGGTPGFPCEDYGGRQGIDRIRQGGQGVVP